MPTKFKLHVERTHHRVDNRHKMYDIKRMQDPELRAVKEFRGSGRWQKVQRNQVSKYPTCYDPFSHHHAQGLPALTASVHHVIGLLDCLRLGQLERLGSHPLNLRSLCNQCHNRVEGIYDRQGSKAAESIFITEEQREEIINSVL